MSPVTECHVGFIRSRSGWLPLRSARSVKAIMQRSGDHRWHGTRVMGCALQHLDCPTLTRLRLDGPDARAFLALLMIGQAGPDKLPSFQASDGICPPLSLKMPSVSVNHGESLRPGRRKSLIEYSIVFAFLSIYTFILLKPSFLKTDDIRWHKCPYCVDWSRWSGLSDSIYCRYSNRLRNTKRYSTLPFP
ncbi:hypothetical protein VTK56DRAFT_4878 [Thermocarpiscus australiensis]